MNNTKIMISAER